MPIRALLQKIAHREGAAMARARLAQAAPCTSPESARKAFAIYPRGSTMLGMVLGPLLGTSDVDAGFARGVGERAMADLYSGQYKGGLIQSRYYDSWWMSAYEDLARAGWTNTRAEKAFKVLLDRQNNINGMASWPESQFYDHIHRNSY